MEHSGIIRNQSLYTTVTVNTLRACVYFAATVFKLSYLVIVLMGLTIVVNIQLFFLSLDLIPRWLSRDIG